MRIANVDGDVFMRALEDPGYRPPPEAGREEALDILGDFVVYPTLFLETDDGERHVLARGYADYPVVAASLPPCSAEGRRLGDTPRQRVRPRRALRYFSMKGKRSGRELFKSSLPEPLHKNFDSWEAAQQEFVPVKGKTSYPMCKPFPLFLQIKNPPSMSERVLFLSTRKSDKEGFDNIESLGRKDPGEGRCYRCP